MISHAAVIVDLVDSGRLEFTVLAIPHHLLLIESYQLLLSLLEIG